ncbi:MAG: biotin/lipoyl-binding protein [Balneolia bacterium]|nr:biotin/lipoyl-binding protein [Balneolia bacterium]
MRTKPLLMTVAAVSMLLIFAVVLLARSQSGATTQPGYEGRIVAEKIHLSAKVPGRVTALHVSEGMRVDQGDLLAELDLPELTARRNQANGALQSARAQYHLAINGATVYDRTRAEASLDAAQAQYDLAYRSVDRLRAMYSDSLIAAQQFEEMEAAYKAASAQLKAAQVVVDDLKSGTRSEKIEMAQGDVIRAESALEEVEALLRDAFIKAPRSMVVESISMRESELAPAGLTIISGYSPDDIYVRITAPESELGRFRKDRTMEGTILATGEVIPLRVASTRALPSYATRSTAYPNHTFDEKWYEVRLEINGEARPDILANGMRVVINHQ